MHLKSVNRDTRSWSWKSSLHLSLTIASTRQNRICHLWVFRSMLRWHVEYESQRNIYRKQSSGRRRSALSEARELSRIVGEIRTITRDSFRISLSSALIDLAGTVYLICRETTSRKAEIAVTETQFRLYRKPILDLSFDRWAFMPKWCHVTSCDQKRVTKAQPFDDHRLVTPRRDLFATRPSLFIARAIIAPL